MEFNERLKTARKQARMTQVELAEKAGIAVNSVRLYEAGKIVPKLDTIEKISGALSVDFNWLLNGFTLEEHNEAFINRISGHGDTSARDLYLQKHPNDEPAKTPKRNFDFQKMVDGLDDDGLKMLEAYAEFLISKQKANAPQDAPAGPDDKEPAEK